jgi:hypothetical protein
VSTLSRWLNWTPRQPEMIETPPETELTKPTKPSFVSFGGPVSQEKEIIRDAKSDAEHLSDGCPYTLPAGVRLARYTAKNPPVALMVCSVVTDVPKFIRHALAELEARLHHPVQIKAGDSVFQLLSKLADCGLELRIKWPPASEIMGRSQEPEPTKPTEPPEPHEGDSGGADSLAADDVSSQPITDEDLPF